MNEGYVSEGYLMDMSRSLIGQDIWDSVPGPSALCSKYEPYDFEYINMLIFYLSQ